MFTVLFFSHGSCHPKFKIKATSSKHSWLSHNFSSGSNFYFYNSLQRELEIEAGTEVSQLEQWVLYFPSEWSAQHSCPIFIFLMLVQPIFTWISSLLSPLCPTGGARRTEAYAYVDVSAYGNKRLHFIDQN